MRLWPVCAFLLVMMTLQAALGQSVGDYRTAGSGDWNTVGTWQRYNGSSWETATTPTSADGTVTLQAGHNVTIPNGFTVSADQLVVNSALVIAAGGQLTLADGAGTDLTVGTGSEVRVSGVFLRANGSTIDSQNAPARFSFLAGSEYRHDYTTTFGTLPYATWSANSTVIVQGFTNTTLITGDASWNQSLGNFTYNATGSKSTVDFAGQLRTIRGNFLLQSSGTGVLQFSTNQNPNISIEGNFTVISGRFILATTGNATIATVEGNFVFNAPQNAGSFLTYTGNTTLNLHGNFSMTATGNGRFHLANSGSTGVATVNVSGNFSLVSGRIDELGANPTQATLRFVGSGIRTFTNTGSIIGYINYYISPTTVLNVGTSPLTSTTPATFRLAGTVIVGSLDVTGAIQTSTTAGNIRTTNTYRQYLAGSQVVYGGAGAQYIGNGQPATEDVTTVINNANGVSLTANIALAGALNLQNGILNLNGFQLTSSGTFTATNGRLGAAPKSKLVISGTTGGLWGTLAFAPSANHLSMLTLGRTGTDAEVRLNSALRIDSLLVLNQGIFTNTSGLEMRPDATISVSEAATLAGASPMVTGGTYNVSYKTFSSSSAPASFATGRELPADATSLGNLTVGTAQTTDVVNLSADVTINGILKLTKGTFSGGTHTIVMQGSAWEDNGGAFGEGTSTVVFNGANTDIGGTFLGPFYNLTINAGKKATLATNLTMKGNLTIGDATGVLDLKTFALILSDVHVQTISANGASLSIIQVAKSGGNVQLTSPLNLTSTLRFVSPSTNMNFASNGNLTLLSTSDAADGHTATIFELLNGNQVSGDVTVQRFVSPEGRMYRYISSAVSNATVAQWIDDFTITGNFLDPSPTQTICGYTMRRNVSSLFYYDETVIGDVNQGYIGYPLPGMSTTNSTIEVAKGYSAFIRNCTTPTIIDVAGPVNQGAITFPVTYTNTADVDANGWNLVGNPYPASIDWDVSGWAKTRIGRVISVMDNATGMMRYYDPGVTNDIPGGVIAPGQAFYARATGANPLLRSQEAVKVIDAAEFFREPAPAYVESFSLTLSDGVMYDAAYVKINEGALAGLDSLDAPKLYNPEAFSFSTVATDERTMAINALRSLRCGTILPLETKNMEAGQYSIALNVRGIDGYRFVLTDHYLHKTTELTAGEYTFAVTAEGGSSDIRRFSLTLEAGGAAVSAPSVVNDPTTPYSVQVSPTSKDMTYTLVNDAGTLIAGPVQGNGGELSLALPAALLTDGGNALTVSSSGACARGAVNTQFTVEKDILGEVGGVLVKVYPNPMTEVITLEVKDHDVRGVQFTTMTGQVVTAVPVESGKKVYTVDVSKLGSGMYLMVVDKINTKSSYRVIKK